MEFSVGSSAVVVMNEKPLVAGADAAAGVSAGVAEDRSGEAGFKKENEEIIEIEIKVKTRVKIGIEARIETMIKKESQHQKSD